MKPPSKNWFTITQIEPGVNSEHVLLLQSDFWPFFGTSGNLVWQSKSGGKPLAELGKNTMWIFLHTMQVCLKIRQNLMV